MAEVMRFFDSTEDDERIYTAADFADYLYSISGSGVSNDENLSNLSVEAKTNMDVGLGSGKMFYNGYQYSNTDNLTLTHDTSDVDNDRIDRIVIRFDLNPEERSIHAVIKKGTPASSPKPPALTRDSYIHEMSVAQVRVIAGKSFVEQDEITDERANDEVCGYLLLHNIYRGLKINEHGTVTMPNQSYVEYERFTTTSLPSEEEVPFVLNNPQLDEQNEIENNSFVAKTGGAYVIVVYVRFSEGDLDLNTDVQVIQYVNEEDKGPVFARVPAHRRDNIFEGTTIQYLNKGDKMRLAYRMINPPSDLKTANTRYRIAKIN